MLILITVDDSGAKAMLDTLQGRVADMSPVMKSIAAAMHDAVEENFEQEGRPKWMPLAPATVKQREKLGYGGAHPILQRSGDLAKSIVPGHTATTAFVSTNWPYAAIHQFGGWAGRGRKVYIPARPFLKLADDDIADIEGLIGTYLTKGL